MRLVIETPTPPPDAVDRTVMRYVPLGNAVGSNVACAVTDSSVAPPVPDARTDSGPLPARVALIFQVATDWPSGGVIGDRDRRRFGDYCSVAGSRGADRWPGEVATATAATTATAGRRTDGGDRRVGDARGIGIVRDDGRQFGTRDRRLIADRDNALGDVRDSDAERDYGGRASGEGAECDREVRGVGPVAAARRCRASSSPSRDDVRQRVRGIGERPRS